MKSSVQTFKECSGDVRRRLADSYTKAAQRYNLRHRPLFLRVGQEVWKKNFTLSDKVEYYAGKLAPKYIKCGVVRRVSTNVYELVKKDALSNELRDESRIVNNQIDLMNKKSDIHCEYSKFNDKNGAPRQIPVAAKMCPTQNLTYLHKNEINHRRASRLTVNNVQQTTTLYQKLMFLLQSCNQSIK
ncbi:hypothetical protein JTB14_010324 [Gonioctena quinquepunctata]|nr:hypothetical protein JTB14_010324 [Gonioctena quinquepunctata]